MSAKRSHQLELAKKYWNVGKVVHPSAECQCNRRNESVTVCCLCNLGNVGHIHWRGNKAWPVVVWHVFWAHAEVNRRWTLRPKAPAKVKILLEVRVETNVCAQTGPIISICEVDIMPMHYIHVLAN